jgi:surface antigen
MACEGNNYGQKQTAGAVLGGIAGGLLGSKVGGGSGRLAATAAGTLLGVLIGSEIGKSLDRADRLYAARTTQGALETNQSGVTSSWSNPDSGHSGTVTPQPAYQSSSGQYCREYQQQISVGGRTESAHGTACRQPDGSWKIING